MHGNPFDVRVRDLMTSPVVTLPASSSVADAAKAMIDHRIGCVVVVDDEDGALIGIVCDSDLVLREDHVPYTPYDVRAPRLVDAWVQVPDQVEEAIAEVRDRRLDEVIRAPLATTSANEELLEASHVMFDSNVTHLPVVEDGELVGIVSQHDLLKAIAEPARPESASP